MKTLEVTQGTPEWIEARAKRFCASEAPAMMGASKYMTRSDLLRQKALDTAEDVDANQQALFDRGHAAEAAARPLVEAQIVDELFPATATDDSGRLLASFDGITMDGTTGYEHKLWNEEVAAMVRAGELSPMYYWQLEQQILVGGLERVIFVCSDGTSDRFVSMEYRAVPGRAEQLLAGWKQFEADLANYQHVEVIPAAVAAPVMALPALSIQVTGSIALVDNLKVFGERLEAFIEAIDKSPSDDQGFADAEAAIKTLATAETALDAAKASALAQTASIDEMTRTVALYAGQARQTRLMLEKMVKARKETIRVEIVGGGKSALAEHIASLNKRIGRPYMPVIQSDFVGVIKGKRTIASLRDAVDTELARAKIEANAVADRIQINLTTLEAKAAGLEFLFNDIATICLKPNGDFMDTVNARIAAHKEAEVKRIEAEREKIRAEEEAKAKAKVEAEARAKAQAEERQRREIEEAKRKADAQREADLKAKEEATRTKPEPQELNKVATVGGSQPVDASKEPVAAVPGQEVKTGQIPAARSATLSVAASRTRPTDDAIISAVAHAFNTDFNQALVWIAGIENLQARADRRQIQAA